MTCSSWLVACSWLLVAVAYNVQACGSCGKAVDDILPEDIHLGDWKWKQANLYLTKRKTVCERC